MSLKICANLANPCLWL